MSLEAYQEQYIENTRRISSLMDFRAQTGLGFDEWYRGRTAAREETALLKNENISLLGRYLFPTLDDLYSASSETLDNLAAFAGELMDWRTNLDCGVYVVIHDALLSACRFRKDRAGVIRELYLLGMGFYYLRRFLTGIDDPTVSDYDFQNEMLFTEAGSYMRYFEQIADDTTCGYIIRALANVALCTSDRHRRIAVTARTLQILQDPHYRQLAPSLPWDAFLRKSHQQMSSNRTELTRSDLTKEELAAVLDSCYEVYKPEENTENPSVRWLWPYYEMEFNCGYVGLDLTLRRLMQLIDMTPWDSYDMSGLYANVQLPVFYGRLLRSHPKEMSSPEHIHFLDRAYRKMLKTLLSCPAEQIDDYYYYTMCAVITDYCEVPGVMPYREVIGELLPHLGGDLCIRFYRTGDVIACIADTIYTHEPSFFDDIPFLSEISDPAVKKEALLSYARQCGIFFDFGLLKMNIQRTMASRRLFENEFRMYQLHTVSGHDDLICRPSTERFADIALGHHRWYNGTDGYPERYVRTESPYRQITDIVAFAAALTASYEGDLPSAVRKLCKKEGTQFSPLVTMWMSDPDLLTSLEEILQKDDRAYYRPAWEKLVNSTSYAMERTL